VGEYLDDEMEPDPELNRISNLIIGAAIEVHRTLGPGHRESVYEEALAIEMRLRQIPFSRQHAFQIVYKGSVVGSGSLDFLVSERVIVDLKTIDEFTKRETAQMVSYLTANNKRLAILLNFNVHRLVNGIRRVAL
jgi:GxxExxY protein